jgi:putative SOS response-associated peptidase YedK
MVKPLHDRMPVIIPDGLENIWLEPGDGAHRRALEPMLTPSPPDSWECRTLKPASSTHNHQQLSLLD